MTPGKGRVFIDRRVRAYAKLRGSDVSADFFSRSSRIADTRLTRFLGVSLRIRFINIIRFSFRPTDSSAREESSALNCSGIGKDTRTVQRVSLRRRHRFVENVVMNFKIFQYSLNTCVPASR